MTISQRQSDYTSGQYKTPVKIYEVIYTGVGAGTFYYGENGDGKGVAGHIEPSPDSEPSHDDSSGMTIYPGAY